jgi:hypothetical protein
LNFRTVYRKKYTPLCISTEVLKFGAFVLVHASLLYEEAQIFDTI